MTSGFKAETLPGSNRVVEPKIKKDEPVNSGEHVILSSFKENPLIYAADNRGTSPIAVFEFSLDKRES